MKLRVILIPILTLLLCTGVLYYWTVGFSAFTIFSYSLAKANPVSKAFPALILINQDGKNLKFQNDYYKLVNFVYLDCPFVCHKVNNQIEGIYHLTDTDSILKDLHFVTISFDPLHDNVAKIKRYRSYFGTDINRWDFAIPTAMSSQVFYDHLQKIGLWKYQDKRTGVINHSTSLYLVSPTNKIVAVFNPSRDSDEIIAQKIHQCIARSSYLAQS